MIRAADHLGHAKHDLAVIEQQRIPRCQILGKIGIGNAHTLRRARVGGQLRIQPEFLALEQIDGAIDKTLNPDLGPLQVAQDADIATLLHRRRADHVETALLVAGSP